MRNWFAGSMGVLVGAATYCFGGSLLGGTCASLALMAACLFTAEQVDYLARQRR